MLTKLELEKQLNTELLSVTEAAKLLGVVNSELLQIIADKKIERGTAYFEIGKDVQPYARRGKGIPLLFSKTKLEEINLKFDSLTAIREELNRSEKNIMTLISYIDQETLFEIRLSTRKWDKDWFRNNTTLLEERRYNASFNRNDEEKVSTDYYFGLLDAKLQDDINKFKCYRLKNQGISFDGVDYVKSKINKEATADFQISRLVRSLYKMKCYRAQINPNTEEYIEQLAIAQNNGDLMPSSVIAHFRKLKHNEEEIIKSMTFDVRTIDEQDKENLFVGYSEITQLSVVHNIRPFLYYKLMLEEDAYERALEDSLIDDDTSFNSHKEWTRIKLMKKRFERFLKKNINQRPVANQPRRKVYATRSQLVDLFVKVNTLSPSPLVNVQRACQILMGFMTGIRPVELLNLEINKHLDIEDNPNHDDFGYLKKYRLIITGDDTELIRTSLTDDIGWSRMWITNEIAKGGYSPSPAYGTLIVPRLVDYMNLYLKKIYEKAPATKGMGYFFRSSNYFSNPKARYSSSKALTSWIFKFRTQFEGILNHEEINNFSYYETRHTVNNTIVNRTIYHDPMVQEWKRRAAEIHCRHSMENEDPHAKSKVNEKSYQEIIPLKYYYLVLKASLDFPFDKDELLEWENVHYPNGIKQKTPKSPLEPMDLSNSGFESLEDISSKVAELEDKLSILRIPHQAKKILGLEKEERLVILAETKKKLEALKGSLTKF